MSARASAPLACVIGDMDLIRPLGLAGIRCAVMARRGAPQRFSRFTVASLPWADSWESPGTVVETLVRFGRSHRDRPVLFYEEDRDLLTVSRHRAALGEVYQFVIADAALVEALVDKASFHRLAERLGIAVPRTRLLDGGAATLPVHPELPFPFIVKPLTRRTDRWSPVAGSSKAVAVPDARTWEALRRRLEQVRVPVMLQELIAGSEQRIESYHAYIDRQGLVVGEFTGRKIRTSPPAFGHSTALETTDAPSVRAAGRMIVERLGVHGVVKLDFKRRPGGGLTLLEVNPRFNLWHHLGAVAGVNLPALVFADLVGGVRPKPSRARAGVRWCKPWQDLGAARAGAVPMREWLADALTSAAKRTIAWDDPLPFVCGAAWELAQRVSARVAAPLANPAAPAGAITST